VPGGTASGPCWMKQRKEYSFLAFASAVKFESSRP
jgi:hypothetical protein